MLQEWTKILPVFIVEWLVKKNLKVFNKYSVEEWSKRTSAKYVIYPYSNIVILIKEKE